MSTLSWEFRGAVTTAGSTGTAGAQMVAGATVVAVVPMVVGMTTAVASGTAVVAASIISRSMTLSMDSTQATRAVQDETFKGAVASSKAQIAGVPALRTVFSNTTAIWTGRWSSTVAKSEHQRGVHNHCSSRRQRHRVCSEHCSERS